MATNATNDVNLNMNEVPVVELETTETFWCPECHGSHQLAETLEYYKKHPDSPEFWQLDDGTTLAGVECECRAYFRVHIPSKP